MAKKKITPKQKIFAASYAAGKTGAESARLAGYDHADGGKGQASRMLTNANVEAEINRQTLIVLKAADLTENDILQGLMRESALDGQGGPEDQQHGGRIRALELLGKAMPGGMFTDRHVEESAILTGWQLVEQLIRDGCPAMAQGAVTDLSLVVTDAIEQRIRQLSPTIADSLLPMIQASESHRIIDQ